MPVPSRMSFRRSADPGFAHPRCRHLHRRREDGTVARRIARPPEPSSWLAKAGVGTGVADIPTTNALRAFLLMPGPSVPIGAIFFAVGTLIFSYLLLRGRMVPVSIAWLGIFASGLLVVGLPLQLAGFPTGPLSGYYQWLPALVLQVVLGLWLLIKGVAAPAARQPA